MLSLLATLLAASLTFAQDTPPQDVQVVHLRDVRMVLDVVQGADGHLLLGVQGGEPREVGAKLIDVDPAVRWAKHGVEGSLSADHGFDQGLRRSGLEGSWTGAAVAFRADGTVTLSLGGKSGERWWLGATDQGKLETGHRLTQLRWPETIEHLHLEPDGTLVGLGKLFVPEEEGQPPHDWPRLRVFHFDQQGYVTDFRPADEALHDKLPEPVVHPDGHLWFYRAVAPRTWGRWGPSGTRDAGFEAELPITTPTAEAWAALPDGGAVASVYGVRQIPRPGAQCGNDVDKVNVYSLARFGADGSVQDPLIPETTDLLRVHSIRVQADGGLLLVGELDAAALGIEAEERTHLARLAPDGSLDEAFTRRWLGVQGVELAEPLSDGRVAVAGEPLEGLEGLDSPLMVIVPGEGGP